MSRAVTRGEALCGIRRAFDEVEEAIRDHPDSTRSLYERVKVAILEKLTAADWYRLHGLTSTEGPVILQYIVAASFMSAWFHIRGDKRRRDQAAQSACLLVSGLGFDPLDVMQTFIEFEQAWRTCMRSAGIGRGGKIGFLIAVLFVIAIALWLVLR